MITDIENQPELRLTPEQLTDHEVQTRFNEMVEEIDISVSPEAEEALEEIVCYKEAGNQEEYSQWRPRTRPMA